MMAAENEPTPRIDTPKDEKEGKKPGIKWPGAKESVERGVHGIARKAASKDEKHRLRIKWHSEQVPFTPRDP
jgi:hypothetical protein